MAKSSARNLVRVKFFTRYIVNVCLLLITFVNSLEPDQARQNVWPDLDPNCLILMVVLKKNFMKKFVRRQHMQFTQHAKS